MVESIHHFVIGQSRCTVIADADQGARNVLLIEGDQRILIDTGVGSHDPGNPGRLLARLRAGGVDPTSIDAVILTHADVDHIGGAIDGSRLAFPRATHSISRVEAEFWRQRPTRLPPSPLYDEVFRARVNSVPPIALEALCERLQLVDGPRAELVNGISIIAAPGHTPGNTVVRIESQGEALLVVADLFYQPENLATPGWVSPYDYDPELVVETRRALLDEAASNNTLLMAYHVPFPGLGRVRHSGVGWEWTPAAQHLRREG